ncbi:uncharacterized protein [Triticum aestivum]|uniref:uncharacterized protein n=1 Tax=Triticum aestivum TaxID=4565 RepID=UPI001D01D62E|nr:uncharacterized protein LOC123070328 [Triticum aestivum]
MFGETNYDPNRQYAPIPTGEQLEALGIGIEKRNIFLCARRAATELAQRIPSRLRVKYTMQHEGRWTDCKKKEAQFYRQPPPPTRTTSSGPHPKPNPGAPSGCS